MSFFKEAINNFKLNTAPAFNIINYGANAVYADGFKKVVKITDESIVLLCTGKSIEISGELKVELLEQNSISVSGKIKGVTINDL